MVTRESDHENFHCSLEDYLIVKILLNNTNHQILSSQQFPNRIIATKHSHRNIEPSVRF